MSERVGGYTTVSFAIAVAAPLRSLKASAIPSLWIAATRSRCLSGCSNSYPRNLAVAKASSRQKYDRFCGSCKVYPLEPLKLGIHTQVTSRETPNCKSSAPDVNFSDSQPPKPPKATLICEENIFI